MRARHLDKVRRSPENAPNYNDTSFSHIPETREVAERLSAEIWDDGPRMRYRRRVYWDPEVRGQGMWSGWPADERLACWKKLLADVQCPEGSAGYRRSHRTKDHRSDPEVEPEVSEALLELARKVGLG